MGWIKAELDDDTHDRLREIVENSNDPTHVVAGEMLEAHMDSEYPDDE